MDEKGWRRLQRFRQACWGQGCKGCGLVNIGTSLTLVSPRASATFRGAL